MILSFIGHYWLDLLLSIVLFIIITVRIFPPSFAGLNNTYFDAIQKKNLPSAKQSLVSSIIGLIMNSVVFPIVVALPLKGVISGILFITLGIDLYFNKRITNGAIIISGIGIVALYLEKMLEEASEISFLRIVSWKRKTDK